MNQAPTRNRRFHFIEKVDLMNQIPSIEKKYDRNYSCFASLTTLLHESVHMNNQKVGLIYQAPTRKI